MVANEDGFEGLHDYALIVALKYTGNHEKAQEIAQESLLKFYQTVAKKDRVIECPKWYLFRIIQHQFLDNEKAVKSEQEKVKAFGKIDKPIRKGFIADFFGENRKKAEDCLDGSYEKLKNERPHYYYIFKMKFINGWSTNMILDHLKKTKLYPADQMGNTVEIQDEKKVDNLTQGVKRSVKRWFEDCMERRVA